jgi:hypothetical protein
MENDNGEVLINFISGSVTMGTFKGSTPSNVFGPDDYTIGPNQTLSMPIMNMTKVNETSWGSVFVDNIREARQYNFEKGILHIQTLQKTFIFKKI